MGTEFQNTTWATYMIVKSTWKAEGFEIDSHLEMTLKVNSTRLEQVDGRFGVHVFVEAELEVEDPGAGEVHEVVLVGHFAAQLLNKVG